MAISDLPLSHERTLVMGILNVTPDSFADGGRYATENSAIEHGLQMIAEGVDIIDIGGESTRPGAERVSQEEEMRRVIPVVKALGSKVVVSIDTTRAHVAKEAVASGARIINDISAGRYDDEMLSTVAQLNCPYIAMHTRGNSQTMTTLNQYQDVVAEVKSELLVRLQAALAAGIDKTNIVLDPGLGFAKDAEQNWELLNHLEDIKELGFPLLIGASRKRFLGALVGSDSPDDRNNASIALTALLAQRGVWAVRVHGAKAHVDAVRVAGRMS
ncbi:MAG: dihydropteroate synthase [Actinobacteria bacterium]|nr:dihydropteroate synthase [Actinomycetota bacterium]